MSSFTVFFCQNDNEVCSRGEWLSYWLILPDGCVSVVLLSFLLLHERRRPDSADRVLGVQSAVMTPALLVAPMGAHCRSLLTGVATPLSSPPLPPVSDSSQYHNHHLSIPILSFHRVSKELRSHSLFSDWLSNCFLFIEATLITRADKDKSLVFFIYFLLVNHFNFSL